MDPKKDTWKENDKLEWLSKQTFQRSYAEQVLSRIDKLKERGGKIKVRAYGSLSLQGRNELAIHGARLSAEEYEKRYPLYYAEVGDITNGKPNVIITGGTHGYEESGVYGALEFLEKDAEKYAERFNFLVFPCLSPFAYEVNQRWTHNAWDVNRSFDRSKPYVPEAQLVMDVLDEARKRAGKDFAAAVDLHETPDRDKTMMPPQYQRYGINLTPEDILIPNGYYLISNVENEAPEMANHIIASVRKVTPIAPDPEIHGEKNENGVVISKGADPTHQGLNQAYMKTISRNSYTTEIYPEIHPEPRGSQEAIAAQVATIHGILNYLTSES
ncbi:MAG: succinylglutamate desuccinylase/aspartoacylase family protein [Bdellovibrionota bacterium]